MTFRAVALPCRFCAIWLLILTGALSAGAQNLPDRFVTLLQKQMNVSEANLASLERGETVTKLLKTKAKKEIAALGIVRVNASGDLFIDRFRDIADFKKSSPVLQIGKFSNPPVLADLNGLTLDPCCLEAIRNCKTGACDMKMSAEMMTRFQKELSPSAANYQERANSLARRMLFDYLKAYLQTGNAALIEYDDAEKAVRLNDEFRSLLEQSRFLADYAPEFYKYLEEFPKASLPNVEDFIYWSKEKFGLNPVLSLTHVVIYKRVIGESTEVLIASKQLYANHYFDGSLGLGLYVEGVQGPASSGSYMMYLNRSRADALQGWFLGIKRSLVGGRVREGLARNLKLVKKRIESYAMQPSTTLKTDKTDAKSGKPVSRYYHEDREKSPDSKSTR
ncbi:MAG: hypothetical protein WBV94_31680 [Blastocatellia bacterium]